MSEQKDSVHLTGASGVCTVPGEVVHTPGPWVAQIARWSPQSEPFGYQVFAPPRLASVANVAVYETQTPTLPAEWRDSNLARTQWAGHHYTPEELIANANLIAAAPDLLAALQALVERGTDSPEHMAAERAIAKALGASPLPSALD